ncbi:MAG: hypothetical protein ABGW91_06340 [Christiangramia sp.]
MKKYSLLLVMVFMTMVAFAQEKKGWEKKSSDEMAMIYAEKVSSKLSLTAEQKEKIKEAQMKRLEDQKELMAKRQDQMADAEDMADETADMKEKRMKIQEGFKDDMQSILNEEQYAKWENMHQEEMKMMKGKHKGDKMKMHKMKDQKMESEDSDDDNSSWK